MTANTLKELLLYRYRYVFGYILLVVISIGLMTWQLGSIPPGFSELEKQTAVISNSLSFDAESFVNLPYHALQKASLFIFGPSALGIRLPSVLLALALVVASFFLLRRWFAGNIAVIGTILVVTTVYFLLRAREGTPEVLYYLWPTLLLLTATLANALSDTWRTWVWLFTVAAALSLYTPYMGFLLVVLLVAVFASRSGRLFLAEIDGPAVALSGLTFVTLVAPLAYSFFLNPQGVFDYVGINGAPSLSFIIERSQDIAYTLVGYGAQNGEFYPLLSIPSLLFGLYGLYYAIRNIGQARFAVVILWLFTTVALFLSTDQISTAILFTPLALLILIGLWRFIAMWYDLFPRNPYARVVALVPLALLLLVIVQFNYQRYFYGLPRGDSVRAKYDTDIMLLNDKIGDLPRIGNLTVVVPESEAAFMSLLESRHGLVNVMSFEDTKNVDYTHDKIIIAASLQDKLSQSTKKALADRTQELVVDSRPGNDALRFRAY